MRYKLAKIIGIAAMAVSLSACGETANYNANTNANRAANENLAGNVNATVTPTPRRELTREDYERDKDQYQREAKEAGRTIGSGINDGWLWVKTRFDLAAEDDLRDSTINVDVENDVVTLGPLPVPGKKLAPNKSQKQLKESRALGISSRCPPRAILIGTATSKQHLL